MRHLIFTATLTTLGLMAAACDDSTTVASTASGGGTGIGTGGSASGSLTLDQSAPVDTAQQAPMDTLQQVPIDTSQQLPANDQQAPNASATGTTCVGTPLDCTERCHRALAMDCGFDLDCTSICAVVQPAGACQATASELLDCAAAATTCDAMQGCGMTYQASLDCVNPGT